MQPYNPDSLKRVQIIGNGLMILAAFNLILAGILVYYLANFFNFVEQMNRNARLAHEAANRASCFSQQILRPNEHLSCESLP